MNAWSMRTFLSRSGRNTENQQIGKWQVSPSQRFTRVCPEGSRERTVEVQWMGTTWYNVCATDNKSIVSPPRNHWCDLCKCVTSPTRPWARASEVPAVEPRLMTPLLRFITFTWRPVADLNDYTSMQMHYHHGENTSGNAAADWHLSVDRWWERKSPQKQNIAHSLLQTGRTGHSNINTVYLSASC